ncbi:MAG: EpsI family protein [Gemmataceae bacterium]|nr:EpsI family protein [Gemmataceae bacterium]
MSQRLAMALCVVLIAACGVVHGVRSDRWQRSEALEAALAKVDLVPLNVADWVGQIKDSDAASFEKAGAQAYWTRVYTNPRTQQSVLVILMCGRAGRMAVHTPEICYRGAGYDRFDIPTVVRLIDADGRDRGELYTARFTKSSGTPSDLRLYWGWNDGTGWQAPRSPRWSFRGRPFLYKLYVSEELGLGSTTAKDGAAELLRELTPIMAAVLQAGAS